MASDNFIMPSDIWRSLCYSSYKYHQNSVSSYLDVTPHKAFDLHKFEAMLLQKSNSLCSLTLMPVLEELNIPNSNANKNNIGRNIFYTYRKYCPECLKENNYYKLIWQFSSIKFCKLHNIKLMTQCWNCKKNIALLPLNGEIGTCPHCKILLSKGHSTDYYPNEVELFNYRDWEYLLSSSKKAFHSTNNYEPYNMVLFKLLYLLKDTHIDKTETTLMNLYKSLAKYSNLIHIHSILNILRKTNTSFESFINLEVPIEFINSIV